MKLKNGVSARGIRPELVMALGIADGVYRDNGASMTVTSLVDSTHSRTSLHYSGCAADFRTNDISNAQAKKIVHELRGALGTSDFDVILESDHIHLEYQPKGEN